MITHKVGNLLTSNEIDVAIHQANIFCTFGAGIAAAIRKMYPEIYAVDCATESGDEAKLGTYSIGKLDKPTGRLKYFINLYSQGGFGSKDRQTSYDAMDTGLRKVEALLSSKNQKYVLGIPYKMGAGLANGDWNIILAIIESVFANSKTDVIIYYLPEFASDLPK